MNTEIDLPAQAGSDVGTKCDLSAAFGNDGVDTKFRVNTTFGNDHTAVDTKITVDGRIGNDISVGFIRARKRKIKGGHPDHRKYRVAKGLVATASISFDLVRAVRVDGKPRHEFILGLGSQKNIEHWAKDSFWVAAISRLTEHGFEKNQRKRLLTQMVRKGAQLPTIEQCQARWGIWECPRFC